MELVESFVANLNKLCPLYLEQKTECKDQLMSLYLYHMIREIGYKIVPPFCNGIVGYEFLTTQGKIDYIKLQDFQNKKSEAVREEEYERASQFRDLEREFKQKIMIDFSQSTNYQYLVFNKDYYEDVVLLNDPDGRLTDLFKGRNLRKQDSGPINVSQTEKSTSHDQSE